MRHVLFAILPLIIPSSSLAFQLPDPSLSAIPASSEVNQLLCLDRRHPSVAKALRLLDQPEYCSTATFYNFLDYRDGDVSIDNLQDVLDLTKQSPAVISADFSYLASKDQQASFFIQAFAPTFSISSGSWSSIYSNSSTLTKPTPASGQPSITQRYSNSSAQEYSSSLSPTISVPLFDPYSINLAFYYRNLSFSTAYSSSSSDLSQFSNALTSSVDLWTAKNGILIAQKNVSSALTSFLSTYAQYELGALAIPDVAQSLNVLRQYQNNLSSSIESFNTYYAQLAANAGVPFGKLKLSPSFFSVQTVSKLASFPYGDLASLSRQSLVFSDQIYVDYYNFKSFQSQSRSYLSEYLPSFGLSFGWSPSSTYSYNTAGLAQYSGDPIINTYSQTSNSTWGNSLAITFTWDFFDSGANAYLASSSKKNAIASRESAKQAALTVLQTASSNYSLFHNSSNQVAASLQSIDFSRRAYDDTLVALRAGFSNVTTLFQRLTEYSSALTSWNNQLRTLLASSVTLQYLSRDGYFEGIRPYQLVYGDYILDFIDY
ncbi:TolC family protein [Synechococcus sp. A10-1-5-1]|uniref:TolC family protein n=1 Tax=Synechococcus sp. A10-1-5-1 TaxID=2936507 RepID=UPI002000C4EE|nr:TolC family protein [Synechococcus sp. A10-1-5-1]UPM50346.1 TolC family protein [Synechococcus sp. A10-1-5-1]